MNVPQKVGQVVVYQWLVYIQQHNRIAGISLELLVRNLISKDLSGGGNDHRYRKNPRDWTIRSEAPKLVMSEHGERSETKWLWAKGIDTPDEGLRYSPTPGESQKQEEELTTPELAQGMYVMQLVAYGAQDVYLTGNPKVTFFQAVYKRHTNFAMEAIQQTINGSAANGQRISVTIARNGDLVGYMYAELIPNQTTPTGSNFSNLTSINSGFDSNWVAERAFSSVELTIGGQRIDKHYQAWWRLYSELFLSDDNKLQYNKMTTCSSANHNPSSSASLSPVYLPFIFFFNRNPGLYLPLIALQYHEVRLDIDCSPVYSTYFSTSVQPVIWANYVFLDTEERRRFAQKGHEYLIEQVQHTGGDTIPGTTNETTATTIRLSFNHPVKEIVWAYQHPSYPGSSSSVTQPNALWNFTTGVGNVQVTSDITLLSNIGISSPTTTLGSPQVLLAPGNLAAVAGGVAFNTPGSGNVPTYGWTEEGAPLVRTIGTAVTGCEVGPLHKFKLILNGQDRFKEQFGKYFNQVQPFYHHTGNPYPGIYSYSFALHPEEHQPTGTCNFSRIDNAQVQIWLKGSTGATNTNGYVQKLFAVNYNILRIQSGMGGLAFSN